MQIRRSNPADLYETITEYLNAHVVISSAAEKSHVFQYFLFV
jgi:hypothetical protein